MSGERSVLPSQVKVGDSLVGIGHIEMAEPMRWKNPLIVESVEIEFERGDDICWVCNSCQICSSERDDVCGRFWPSEEHEEDWDGTGEYAMSDSRCEAEWMPNESVYLYVVITTRGPRGGKRTLHMNDAADRAVVGRQ